MISAPTKVAFLLFHRIAIVDGSGSENPGPDIPGVCDHTWTETSRTDPTCTTAGKIISQCSECGQTKTEPLPATGHTWVVDRTVQTTYDEEGNLLQQGYTIYSCSVCGEQYKDMEGVGPPGGEEEKSIWEKIGDLLGSGFGSIIEIIEAILSKILDALTSLIDMLMRKKFWKSRNPLRLLVWTSSWSTPRPSNRP